MTEKHGAININIAVIGCGWWTQGWHLPHLSRHENVKIAALVDPTTKPLSTLTSSPLLSLDELSKKYDCPNFYSVSELLKSAIGPQIDGVVVGASHAAHFSIGMAFLNEGLRRRHDGDEENIIYGHRVINILMEKPFTTDAAEAREMCDFSTRLYPEGTFIINHTASYQPQATIARHLISTNKQIGKIRHINATMNVPLMWFFDDPNNHSWVTLKTKDGVVERSGFGWGQMSHILAWIYAVVGDDVAIPKKVYCDMGDAQETGADISLAAVISCSDNTTFAISGTALLPGSPFADPPVGKLISIQIYGTEGSLIFSGDDTKPQSGRLELRRTAPGKAEDGQCEYPCTGEDWTSLLGDDKASQLSDDFLFENLKVEGLGPGSLHSFIDSCQNSAKRYASSLEGNNLGDSSQHVFNDTHVGLKTVQIIDAMYCSAKSGQVEHVK